MSSMPYLVVSLSSCKLPRSPTSTHRVRIYDDFVGCHCVYCLRKIRNQVVVIVHKHVPKQVIGMAAVLAA
jgi:hypothetical protein